MTVAPAPATFKGLCNRLKIKTSMVRKIAIMDLVRQHEHFGTDQVASALMTHLPRETQAKLQNRIIEFLGQVGHHPAKTDLQALAGDTQTDPSVVQAAREAIETIG